MTSTRGSTAAAAAPASVGPATPSTTTAQPSAPASSQKSPQETTTATTSSSLDKSSTATTTTTTTVTPSESSLKQDSVISDKSRAKKVKVEPAGATAGFAETPILPPPTARKPAHSTPQEEPPSAAAAAAAAAVAKLAPPSIRRTSLPVSKKPATTTTSTTPAAAAESPATTATADSSTKSSLPATTSPDRKGSTTPSSGSSSAMAVLEFKTYRSPPRNKKTANAATAATAVAAAPSSNTTTTTPHDEEVPSLCSTSSQPGAHAAVSAATKGGAASAATSKAKDSSTKTPVIPTSSISVDPSKQDTTSPLASHDCNGSSKMPASDLAETTTTTSSSMRATTPTRSMMDMNKNAPSRSPLPALDDAKEMASPGGLFLSPNPPTPSAVRPASSFEEKKRDDGDDGAAGFEGKPSPRGDRERYVATPTDFALDYGKGHAVSGSFDTSNVLAWLQSPTANGLFSPGGLGSIMNTPAGGAGNSSGLGVAGAAAAAAAAASRTPRTPTVSTSFFFSDVAGLPRNENVSPKGGDAQGGEEGSSGNKRSQKAQSNIICISPLASNKQRNGVASSSNTPMNNFKDVFASPKARGNLPLLSDTPSKADRLRVPQRSGSKDPSLDAHLAERDLMEDEDLSVLLQLASNTPGRNAAASSAAAAGGPVFRSPNRRKNGEGGDGSMPSLQLPMIGNAGDGNTKTRLAQKSSSRSRDLDDFAPPQLGMRSSSSHGAKKENSVKPPMSKDEEVARTAMMELPTKKPKKSSRKSHYQMPQYPPRQPEAPTFYPSIPTSMPSLPPGLQVPPGPQGSMRVVVGGPCPPPPPTTSGISKGSPPRPGHGTSPHPPPPHYHDYPPPPPPPHAPGPYAPPPGMYGAYAPYGASMGRYPPYGHYPTPGPPGPRHMPMYTSAQHPPGTGPLKDPKKGKAKAGGKRPSPLDAKATGKKHKKNGPPKKKNKSPQITDGAERRKAAATIHAVNSASGGKNDRAAALAAAILRGVTMRPSGKWQAQLYFAGKSRYIGVFDTREKAALAYEIAREKLKSGNQEAGPGGLNPKSTENLVNAARKAAFEGVNERLPK